MIVWFNCKISDIRPNPQPRYHLRNDDRLDIAKYSFASFAPLEPLISKFIFNLEMADAYQGKESEMEDWLRQVLPEEKLELNWFRCNTPEQWRTLRDQVNEIDDDLIFPAGNEDHIFIDSSIDVFSELLELIKNDPSKEAVIMTSHWPENIRAARHFNGQHQGSSVSYTIGNNDALRVMKKDFFNWYVDQLYSPDMFIFRTEHWNSISLPVNRIYVPTKEQFRHFDGYGHVNIGPGYCPPLEIPPGFFDKNILIRYGFKDRISESINLNPLAEDLYAATGIGTDYKWCLEDLPLFWEPFVKEKTVDPSVNFAEMQEARDINLLMMSRLNFDWPHFSVYFREQNYPPVSWLNPHMLSIEFTD